MAEAQSLGYAYKWQFIGPDSTPVSTAEKGNWTGTGMGWVESLYVYPDSQTLLAGSIVNGVFISRNGGEDWKQLLALDPQVGVLDILVSGKKIYIATGLTHFDEDFGLGLYRSKNLGKKWKPTDLQFKPEDKVALWGVEMSLDKKSMTAISTDAIYYSPKKAKNWQKVFEEKDCQLRTLLASVHSPKTVYASGRYLLISDNFGKNWVNYTDSLTAFKLEPDGRTSRIALAEDPNTPGRILAAYAIKNFVFIDESLDYGKSWRNIERTRTISRFDQNHAEIAIAPGNPDFIVAGAVRCYVSTGSVLSFSLKTYPTIGSVSFAHDDIRSVFLYDARTIYIGTDGGVFMSSDSGKTWQNKTGKGFRASMIYGLGQTGSGIGVGCQDLGYLFYENGQWKSIGTLYGDGGDLIMHDSTLFMLNNGRFMALNISADRMMSGAEPAARMTPFTAHYVKATANTPHLYFISDEVWQYNGKSWRNLTKNQNNNGYKLSAFAVDSSEKTMYYAYDQPSWGNPMLQPKFFKSSDGGETWEDLSERLPILNWRFISAITTNPANVNEVYVSLSMIGEGTIHKVYRSLDGGNTWENWSEGLKNLNTYKICFVPGSRSSLYLAAQDGLYYRNASMTSWMKLKGEISNVAVRDLLLDPVTKTVIIATYGNGVWALYPSDKMWTD